MQIIFLVVQIILAIAIVGAVLLQKTGSDGLGNLGGGGGISGNSIISSRTSASFLTKATTFLAICFMINSLILGNLAMREHKPTSIVEQTINKEKEEEKKPEVQVPVSE